MKNSNMTGRILLVFIILFSLNLSVYAQDNILTASEYLDAVSSIFGEITDYEARISITQDETVSTGTIFYKNPHLIRINFDEPADQVIVIDGTKLQIYIPEYQVILEQELPEKSARTLTALASSQGLNILRNNYSVAYLTGPDLIPIDEGSEEKVIKLKFSWRDIKEGFKEIVISFANNGVIRRMRGVQAITEQVVQFDYTGIILNQGIPDERFNYEPPPYANVYDNFLFGDN